jgi:hypothetical protein
MKHTLHIILTALLLAPLAALHAADHVLFMNSDYNHYFAAAPEVKRGPSDDWVEPMRPEFTVTKKGLENYIDEIARGHLTHFVMNLNCQRANFPSKTFEPIWKSLDEPERDHLDYIRALKALYESGVDPYQVWIDRCRVKGIQPWISIRMNDLHRHDVPKSPWISTFWHEHPEYRLRPDGWDNGLNYTLEPVRKRMLDFITEVLERYDPAGLELDLMRFRRYLPIGREKECAPIFTEYMREIRKVVNAAAAKRGHPITLSVRLMSKPSGSRELGMEADVWAKEGIVDVIVPTSPWKSFDFDIPLAEWRTWTGDKVLIVPSADEAITENGKRRRATLEEYRRWASIMHERGAKGLYLFNFFMHRQDGPVWNGVLSGGLAPQAALHAADKPEPVASDDKLAEIMSRKPSGIPLAPILDPGPEFADEKRLCQIQPNIAISPKGRIWLTWNTGARFEGDREEPGYVVLFTSGDGGKSFQGPVAVVKSPLGTIVHETTVWIDPLGRLWWYYLAPGGVVANIADDPEAAKPHFQPPFYVTSGSFGNLPTVLADGSWLWTATQNFPTLGFEGLTVYRSQDEGKSFAFVSSVNLKPDTGPGHLTPGEPWAVELRDGRIALFLRTASGAMKTISADGGHTWGDLEPLPPGLRAVTFARFFVRRLKSGNLLLVYNRPPEGPDPLATKGPLVNLRQLRERTHMTAVLSEDDGVTWKGGLRLDDRDSPSYLPDESPHRRIEKLTTSPGGDQTEDGTIWLTYDLGRYGADGREIVVARIREADVLAGKLVSPDSRLKICANKLTTPRHDYIPINPGNPKDPDHYTPNVVLINRLLRFEPSIQPDGIFKLQPRLGDLKGLETDLFTVRGPIHFKSQLKDGVQEITLAPPANVKLTVIVPDYATGKTGRLTDGAVREDGWRELPLTAGKPTTLLIPAR